MLANTEKLFTKKCNKKAELSSEYGLITYENWMKLECYRINKGRLNPFVKVCEDGQQIWLEKTA